MTMTSAPLKISLLAGFALAVLTGCRTTLKPITDTSEPVPIEMQVIGLRSVDQERAELVYTLSNCGTSNANGIKGNGSLVVFQAQGVKKDDFCDLRVESGKTDIGVANWRDEPGLMYIASRVKIGSSEGKLYGLAFVQQKYVSTPTLPNSSAPAPSAMVWKLKVEISASSPLSNCTCAISCIPGLTNNVAMLEPTDASSKGSCSFANLITPESKSTSCKTINVQCGSDFYLGTWQSPKILDGSVAGESTLPVVTLIRGTPDATSDATIEVIIPQ